MAKKGSVSDDFRDYIVLEQLAGLQLVCRSMFGGNGLYLDDVFFGILHRDGLYLRTDEATRRSYEERGLKPLSTPSGRTLSQYFPVDAEVVEDQKALQRAVAAAAKAGSGAKKSKR